MSDFSVNRVIRFALPVLSLTILGGCANYEVNSQRGNIPGHYIRTEMQQADRAVEAARQAGKDKICPVEFKEAEMAKDNAYDVFRACHTEEGAALAKQATEKANALCPPNPLKVSKAVQQPVKPAAAIVADQNNGEMVTVLALEDIHFEFNKSELTPEAKEILKRNVQLLADNPKARVRIAGYTSAAGTEDYNQKLSVRRADAVRTYLINEKIISPARLTEIGYGETKPAVYEATPSDINSSAAKANMRVLFEISVK
jgi:outer membrane protein OmpA-like peptidoglycan-associated protein